MENKGKHPCDWAVASFERAMEQKPAEIIFEPWQSPEGEVFRLYVFPMSAREQDALIRARAAGGMEPILETIIQRAKDRDGKRIFQSGHRARLRNEGLSDELSDLAIKINTAVPQPSEDIEAAAKS